MNEQKPTPRAKTDGQTLLVHSLFRTIQGEGPFAGRPAVFLRLAGCNLQCPMCDTEYTEGAECHDVEDLLEWITAKPTKLLVVTGGEPFRQNLLPLICAAYRAKIHVQIETNGKIKPQNYNSLRMFNVTGKITIVVSPKTSTINAELAEIATAYKYVVNSGDVADDGLPTTALGHPLAKGSGHVARPPVDWSGPIYVQPADEQNPFRNKLNQERVVQAVLQNPNYTLSLQMHKIIGLP